MNPDIDCYVIEICRRSDGQVVQEFAGLPKAKAERTLESIRIHGNSKKYSTSMCQKTILIKSCDLHFLWYSGQIGKRFAYLGEEKADNRHGFEYKVRTESGRTNFVNPEHCVLTEQYKFGWRNIEPNELDFIEIKLS